MYATLINAVRTKKVSKERGFSVLEVREKTKEVIFIFHVKFHGFFKLALPRNALIEDCKASKNGSSEYMCEIFAKTHTGSLVSMKVTIRNQTELEELKLFPRITADTIYVLRHLPSPYQYRS